MQYWLIKSEPEEFGIDDLENADNKTTHWDGVRNYQARNMMRDEMKVGDKVFYYHSNCDVPGIVGIAKVTRRGYPDHTAFDPKDPHFDERSDPENPRWFMVDVTFVRKLPKIISLHSLKQYADNELEGMTLLRRGNRLSVMPVSPEHWKFIRSLK